MDVNYWRARFADTYRRALSSAVASSKAQVLISRKALIGLKPEEQAKMAGTSTSLRPHGLYPSFKGHHYGPTKGTHFYNTHHDNQSSSSSPSSSSSSDD